MTNASMGDKILIVPKTHKSKTERQNTDGRKEKERAGKAQKTGNER